MIDGYLYRGEGELEAIAASLGGLWTADELAVSFGYNVQTVCAFSREAGFSAPKGRGHRAFYNSDDARKLFAERGSL